ncbi:MAG TPA: cation diffusion facilitator family transporter [Anaeromyxobacteraceae bacterium]|nr:cation diffusion facilitator family transporter [Anaeromyxobacteraceae bacterium]
MSIGHHHHHHDHPAEGGHAHHHGPHGHELPRGEPLDHAHAHALGAHAHGKASVRRLFVSVVLTATIMVAEAVGGWMSGSLALISDAGHMLTDAGALLLALVAAWVATRPPDDKRTYGWRRAEVLAAQLNVGVLMGLTAWIAWEAVQRLTGEPHRIELGLMAIVAGVGLVANLAILAVLRHEHGLNARSAFLHVLADTISSVAILLGAAVMWARPDWTWLDPVLSVAIAALILWGAVRLIREITDILMESVPGHLDVAEVTLGMTGAVEGVVVAVHDLHIWTISSGLYALSAHVVVCDEAMGRNDEILTAVKTALRDRFQIDHATLQIESARYAHVTDVCSHAH